MVNLTDRDRPLLTSQNAIAPSNSHKLIAPHHYKKRSHEPPFNMIALSIPTLF